MRVGFLRMMAVLFWVCLAGQLQSQTLCPPDSCDCLSRLAEQYARANDYVPAIRHYNAAIQCAPEQKQVLNARIEALFLQIDSLRQAAERQREQTRDTERQVAKATREAANKAADMKKQQKVAENQQAEADSLLMVAEAAQSLAFKNSVNAQDEARRTQEALDRLQVVFGDLTDIFLQQAREFIYQLEYDSALHRAQEAAYLGVPDRRPALRRVQMELAFVFHETGEKDLLAPLLDSLGLDASPDVLKSLHLLDSMLLDTLEQRYYPNMISIAGGTFTMGSRHKFINLYLKDLVLKAAHGPFSERGNNKDEYPAHLVTLSDFELASTETTWWQYALYCRSKQIDLPEAAPWGRKGDNPVEEVSWKDTQGYVKWLNTRSRGTYQLPTEAEWEYAARGGSEGSKSNYLYSGSNDLDKVGWYDSNSGSKTNPVMQKKPNQLGLYDMSGNMLEWCADWYGDYPKSAQVNPKGPEKGQYRVLRGGSWGIDGHSCRSAERNWGSPGGSFTNIGFRVSRRSK